jgi:hypothetical protein
MSPVSTMATRGMAKFAKNIGIESLMIFLIIKHYIL